VIPDIEKPHRPTAQPIEIKKKRKIERQKKVGRKRVNQVGKCSVVGYIIVIDIRTVDLMSIEGNKPSPEKEKKELTADEKLDETLREKLATKSDWDKEKLIKETLSDIEVGIRLLSDAMRDNAIQWSAFKVHSLSNEEEEAEALEQGRTFIEVTSLGSDDDAFDYLLEAWKAFFADKGISTKFVSRYPGIVFCQGNHSHISGIVASINRLKRNFKVIFQSLANVRKIRHAMLRKMLPGIMYQHVRREIKLLDPDVTNIWCNWVSRAVKNELRRDAAITILDQASERPSPEGVVPSKWIEDCNNAVRDIKAGRYKGVYRVKLRTYPVPIVSYRSKDPVTNNLNNDVTFNFNIPCIVLVTDAAKIPPTTGLTSFVPSKRPTRKSPNHVWINKHLKLQGKLNDK